MSAWPDEMDGPFWWLPFMCRLDGGHRWVCCECRVAPGTPTFRCPEHCIRCQRCGTWRGSAPPAAPGEEPTDE